MLFSDPFNAFPDGKKKKQCSTFPTSSKFIGQIICLLCIFIYHRKDLYFCLSCICFYLKTIFVEVLLFRRL